MTEPELEPNMPTIGPRKPGNAPSPRQVADNINQLTDVIPEAMVIASRGELQRIREAARRLIQITESAFEEEINSN